MCNSRNLDPRREWWGRNRNLQVPKREANRPEPARAGQNRSEPARTGLSRACPAKNLILGREGLQKSKICFPCSVRSFFFLLLMQRGNHNLPFLTPLCRDFAEKKVVVSLQRCYRNRFCASHAPYEAYVFVFPMQREKHIFEIDFTPSV